MLTSFYVGVSGLQVSQHALNTTSHNLANVDTKGYTRQQIYTKDFGYLTVGNAANYANQVGLGTAVEVVKQIRNRYFDASYREEYGRQGYYEAQYNSIIEMEDIFGETEGVRFEGAMTDLWETLQEMDKDLDLTTKSTLVNKADTFIKQAEMIYNQICKYQEDLNAKVQEKVDRINQLGQNIYELNLEIRKYEAAGQERANDLRDERNSYLDELGQLISISYQENEEGMVTIQAEDTLFVSAVNVYTMQTAPEKEGSRLLKPVWSTTKEAVFDFQKVPLPEDKTDIGSLKGILLARGDETANYLHIPIQPKESDFTGATAKQDYEKACAQYERDVEIYNIKIQASAVKTVQAQFDQLIHGMVVALNDTFCPNKTQTVQASELTGLEKEVVLADGTRLVPQADQSVKIYAADGTEQTSAKIQILDEENAPLGKTNDDYVSGEALFERKGVKRYTDAKVKDPISGTIIKTIRIYNEENPQDMQTQYTLGEIEVNQKLLENYALLPLNSAKTPSEIDRELTKKLIDLCNTEFATLGPNNTKAYTFREYYQGMIGEVGNRGKTLKDIAQAQQNTVTAIDNRRQSVMGVSTDEELTNLIKFQHSYNASARYISVIDQMLEHIITRL